MSEAMVASWSIKLPQATLHGAEMSPFLLVLLNSRILSASCPLKPLCFGGGLLHSSRQLKHHSITFACGSVVRSDRLTGKNSLSFCFFQVIDYFNKHNFSLLDELFQTLSTVRPENRR